MGVWRTRPPSTRLSTEKSWVVLYRPTGLTTDGCYRMAVAELPHRGARSEGRVPPHNLDAEESLLGAMLLSRDAIVAATEVGLGADEFYKPAHGHVFDAITTLYSAGEPSDPVTVAEELRRAGLLDAIGGPSTLVTLQASTPATSNAARYARIITELALLRR